MAVNFAEILGKQSESIEKPKPLPVGDYIMLNPKLPEFKGIGKNETPAAVFSFTVVAPTESVDQDQLAEYGEYKGKTQRWNAFLSEASLFRTKEQICEAFGIEEAGKTLGVIFNETINQQIIVSIGHRPSEDGTDIYAEVTGIAHV